MGLQRQSAWEGKGAANHRKRPNRYPQDTEGSADRDDVADPAARLTNYNIAHNPLIFLLTRRFMGQVHRMLKRLGAEHLNGLDAGCGEGHLTTYLAHRQAIKHIVGLDLDHRHLAYAGRYHPVCPFVQADIGRLPFKDHSVDYVLCTEVLEHLPDPGRALEELRRVVRRRGHIVVSVPHEPFFHWGNRLRGQYRDDGGWTPDHVNRWKRREFIGFLERYVTVHDGLTWETFPWLLFHGTFHA
jgi:SAM-dependent methyltransferase